MTSAADDLATSVRHDAPQRPSDAATLIVIRREPGMARILMGQRHAGMKFMPDKFVFPGGRLDAPDGRVKPVVDLAPQVLDKLLLRMRGRASPARARGLAVTALRETLEETGLSLAGAGRAAYDLSGLRLFARAITPPGRTRRFDSRFFVIDAAAVEDAAAAASGELRDIRWFTFAEALGLDLPVITADTLARLRPVVEDGGWPAADGPVTFQHQRHGRWQVEML